MEHKPSAYEVLAQEFDLAGKTILDSPCELQRERRSVSNFLRAFCVSVVKYETAEKFHLTFERRHDKIEKEDQVSPDRNVWNRSGLREPERFCVESAFR